MPNSWRSCSLGGKQKKQDSDSEKCGYLAKGGSQIKALCQLASDDSNQGLRSIVGGDVRGGQKSEVMLGESG